MRTRVSEMSRASTLRCSPPDGNCLLRRPKRRKGPKGCWSFAEWWGWRLLRSAGPWPHWGRNEAETEEET